MTNSSIRSTGHWARRWRCCCWSCWWRSWSAPAAWSNAVTHRCSDEPHVMSRNGPLALVYHTLFVTFMLAPILVVCFVALTPEGYLSFPTDRWSLRWFYAIGRYPEFISAFWRSLWLGALSSAIAVAFSVPAALAIARYRFRGREAMMALFMSPLMIPHVVLGIAFLRFFTQIGLSGTFLGLVLSHVIVILPFALRLVLAASYGMDQRIEHAAVSLGAIAATVFRRVTLPLILPGVV